MSGLVPRRRDGVSGLVPLPGWKAENDWKGLVPHDQLPRSFNPDQGHFVTANQDLNAFGDIRPINLPMGPYRAERIANLLGQRRDLKPSDMFELQFDVYSHQAERFLDILKPLLPNTSQGRILRDWDCRYSADSRGAFLFEAFYRHLLQEVFGVDAIGEQAVRYLAEETGIFHDFYLVFDRVLLADASAWFGDESRTDLYRRVAEEALKSLEPRPWGDTRRYLLSHLMFGGKLPRFLGFDRGPVAALGGRATVHQGQIFRSGGRTTTFVPSFRFVTDLGTDDLFSNLAGGPSDRRFSRWYCSDLRNWISGKYKRTRGTTTGRKRPFVVPALSKKRE
jgi:penicillin amidase